MKVIEKYSHLKALDLLKKNKEAWADIQNILADQKLIFSKGNNSHIKKVIGEKFSTQGWADRVTIGNSKLTISFLKDKVGVCFQIGNVARTYADILKLDYLAKAGIIKMAVIIVPDNIESRKLGANYASFERLKNEIKLFKDIIGVPLLIIGLSN